MLVIMKRKKPNIVLIMTDQLRGDSLGCTGHPDVKTPYIDTLAARGVTFTHAYSSCPSCIAARAALHTGLAQEHHKRTGYEDCVRWDYPHTLAGELGKSGYYTTCIGKMHVHPLRNYLGFDNVILHDGYLHAARYEDVKQQESQFYADDYFHWLRCNLGAAADTTDTGLDCNSWVVRPWCYEEKYHPTNWVTDNCLDFLRRRDPDQPFFLMASYLKPHPPLDPPSYYLDRYLSKDLQKPFIGTWEDDSYINGPMGRTFDSKTGPVDDELIHEMRAGYYALITHLDHQIGRLIMALVEHKLYDDTLILFTSDHGEELGDHHMFRKSRPYEGSCHIPMILSNLKAVGLEGHEDEKNSALVELRDVMPTLLDAAGASSPFCDGGSMLPLVDDPDRKLRSYIHGEHSYAQWSNHWIVTEEDKYIWHSTSGQEQYFNLGADPHELNDLIGDKSKEGRIASLRSTLVKELTGRPEGFTDGTSLVAGRDYPPLLP